MTLATRSNVARHAVSAAVRDGIVAIVRDRATVGATVYAPRPDWTPLHGVKALEALTVTKCEPTHIAATDASGAVWVIWR